MNVMNVLFALAQNTQKLNITVFPGKEGTMKLCIAPTVEKGKDVALATPLTLSGTPDALEAGLESAVLTYQAAQTTLAAQIEATAAIMKAAEKDSAGKAVKALSKTKSSPTAAQNAVSGSSDATDNVEDDESNDPESEGTIASQSSVAATAPVDSGTDLSSLF